jgi:hypothetical protein
MHKENPILQRRDPCQIDGNSFPEVAGAARTSCHYPDISLLCVTLADLASLNRSTGGTCPKEKPAVLARSCHAHACASGAEIDVDRR